jgi:hypothetical protein
MRGGVAALRLSRLGPLVATVSLVAAVLLAGCSGSPGQPSPAAKASTAGTGSPSAKSASPASSATSRVSASASPSAVPVAPGAGALPQTRAFPRTDSAAFRNAMTDLWLAVTTGNPRFGLPAFFPVDAYKQVKAIPYPAADWQDRLWYDFTLDVRAAHGLLAPGARLVRVIVPAADAAWVSQGACYNSTGYWHVPGARVVYREHGQERSFGIASLISWRGVWYVIHFGAVLRSVVTGVVDQPAIGPGIPGPPGGC